MESQVIIQAHAEERATRRRNSLEHEVMRKKLIEWRTKKGLPAFGKYEEDRQKTISTPSYKNNVPSQLAKRKRSHLSQSEKKPDRSSKQMRKFDTPGSSTNNNKPNQAPVRIRATCSTSKKQPGRRSLLPTTNSGSISKWPMRMEKRVQREATHKPEAPPTSTVLPLADRTNKIRVAASISTKPHEDAAKKTKTPLVAGRKSVRFISPQEDSGRSAQQSTTAVYDQVPPVTPASSVKPGIRERLEQWLISKGRTPSQFRNFLGYESSLAQSRQGQRRATSGTPHHAGWGRGRRSAGGTPGDRGRGPAAQEEGRSTVSDAMTECFIMLDEGCPLSYISSWLDGLVTKVPVIQLNASYWLCRAKLAEKEGGDQSALECLFEAVEFGAEPYKEIEESLAAYRLKLKLASEDAQMEWEAGQISSPRETGKQSPCAMPQTPVAHLQFDEEEAMHQSDAEELDGSGNEVDASNLSIKYSLKETTPYFARIHRTPGQAHTTPCLMVTPVRRSTRLDNKRRSVVTLGLQRSPNTEDCLDSVQEVANAFPAAQLILRPNRALATEFSEGDLKESL